MNYKILILASSAILMGACSDNDHDADVEPNAAPPTQSEYVGTEDVAATNETEAVAPELQTDTTDPYDGVVASENIEGDTIGPDGDTSTLTPDNEEDGMPETVPATEPDQPTPQ
ncbi:hypothetical protein WNY37_17480 [Henriciella sp. AS95]|uniref:hypothetical protein n=1 Tax=Henriciella sp. AS95 TaxID=3135782 RepID=UPI00317EDD77